MKKLHEAKKSLTLNVIYGTILLLQFLCSTTPIIVNVCHFWQKVTSTVVCISMRIKNVLMQQDEVILLLLLLRLMYIALCTQLFLHLVLMDMVIFLLFVYRIAAYLLHFFILRHCRIIGTGISLSAKAATAVLLYLLEHEEMIFPLVRAALSVALCISNYLFLCLYDGMMACGTFDPKRVTIFTGNPAFGGRGAGIRRKKRRKRGRHKTFDSTLGFPGEGWAQLRLATWNTRGLTYQRFKYCQQLNYDVLALTELWRGQHKYQNKSTRFITSAPKFITKGPKKGTERFPDDRAAGVGILLSARAQSKLLSFDSEGNRVCYVRLAGPICNLFVIAVYMPHRGRVAPAQDDTIKDLETVLAKVPRGDCICILGDFNEQLESGVKDRTGKWTAGPKSPNSDKIMQLMRLHELTAANTLFEPKSKKLCKRFCRPSVLDMKHIMTMENTLARE